MTEPDVAVVGAGAAGIAAWHTLRALGRSCVVLEAGARVGGRAFTDERGFDHGASWLHDAERNPVVPLAGAVGVRLRRDAAQHVVFVDDRRATAPERRAHHAAARARHTAAARAVVGPDVAVADIGPRGGRWDATVAHFEGTIIGAAEFSRTSLRDWWANALDGSNLVPDVGMGGLVARLAAGLPVSLETRIDRIRWDCALTLEGPRGTVTPRACLVTVSTGVLAAGGVRFDPVLPPALGDAIVGLPLGRLTKVALRARWLQRLGLPRASGLERCVERETDQPPVWVLWPNGLDHAVGFIGGEQARTLDAAGPAATEAFARAELARMLGAEAVARTFRPGAIVTDWGEHPLFRGAYSYALPGHAGARAVLADAALADGRLRFAGEACHQSQAGTVGGAWASGVSAARALHAALR